MNQEAIDIVQKCLDTKDPYLDLGRLGLRDEDFAEGTELDKLLRRCTHLERLVLSDGWWQWNKKGVRVKKESHNGGLYNKLYRIPKAIKLLNGLTTLVISGQPHQRWGITDMIFLANLTYLRHLNIDYNYIYVIRGLDNLQTLRQLSIRGNKIKEIQGLEGLALLELLDIGDNYINEIRNLEGLPSLRQLNLDLNGISEIRGLEKFAGLGKIDISNNGIKNIEALQAFLTRATNPLKLVLKAETSMVQIGQLNVYGNRLQTPPMEVVERGNEAVLRYFSEQLEPAYEAKLLVVGEPEAGKTSLIKKLIDPTYTIPNNEDSTIGIQVIKWNCSHKSLPQSVKLNIWDFGGQEMQYLTHQFFLSSDALYILLTSARKDLDNLDYWFNIISLLGRNEKGENSELLVVANEIKMQEGQTSKTFDVVKYQNLYPYLPFKFHAVNLATAYNGDHRFDTLLELIQTKLSNLPVMGRLLPVKWGIVRKELDKEGVNYLSIEAYLSLCKKAGVDDKFALDLSSYLHKIGEVVHFQSDRTVNNFVILNPKWAVDGIYSILKRKEIVEAEGHFTQKQVYDIWENEKYSFGEKNMLLNLMVKDSFEVAYKIPNKTEEYIAPQLLPLVQPEHEWNKTGAMHFRYLYPFMPKGILTRLIVRLHEDIKYVGGKGLVWRTGVYFEKLGCTAKVEETKIVTTGQQVIAIELTGHTAHRKLLLYDICRSIEGIHKDAFSKILFERQVPCNCEHCQTLEQPGFFNYSELMQYIDDEIDKIRCKLKPKNEITVASLLKGIFDVDFTRIFVGDGEAPWTGRDRPTSEDPFEVNKVVSKMKKLFISYSKHDEEYKKEFHEHLVTLRDDEKLLSDFNCQQIDLGAAWDLTIQNEVENCDIMICLVSRSFLNTDYIRNKEVKKAIALGKQVIPIIIKPCDWETSDLGKLYAPLRGKPVSLNHEKLLQDIYEELTPVERDGNWTKVVKEMREKLFNN